jgi:alkanesulfonate monooxygenase
MMAAEVFWRLPVDGDGRALLSSCWNRGDYAALEPVPNKFARTGGQREGHNYFDHLSQIARAAELSGFEGVWIPQSPAGEEPQIVASALAREARRLKFVISLWTPLLSAVYTAKIANSFQRLSGGRLAWNFITEPPQPRAWHGQGPKWTLEDQVARTGEFLEVSSGFWHRGPYAFKGRFYEVENGGFPASLGGEAYPTIYVSGATEEERALSARQGGVHILPIAPLAVLEVQIASAKAAAAAQGRALRFGIETDIVARHSAEEAWADIRGRWSDASGKTTSITGEYEALPDFDSLIGEGNLWNGFGLVRRGAPAGLVGSYAELADRLAAYARLGVTTFVLSANPHLEEAYLLGEHLLPKLRAQTDTTEQAA